MPQNRKEPAEKINPGRNTESPCDEESPSPLPELKNKAQSARKKPAHPVNIHDPHISGAMLPYIHTAEELPQNIRKREGAQKIGYDNRSYGLDHLVLSFTSG